MKKYILYSSIIFLVLINSIYSFNPDHLAAINKKPFDQWEQWRMKNLKIRPDLSNAVIQGVIFNGDYSNINFKYANIVNCIIYSVNFTLSDFSFSIIKNWESPLSAARMKSYCRKTNFSKSKISDSQFNSTEFIEALFNEANIFNTKINSSSFINVKFLKSTIINCYIGDSIENVDFSHSQIKNSQIEGRKFFNIKFRNAKITDSVIYAEKSNNLDFSQSDLIRVEFGCSRFTNVYFVNTNLPNSSFGDRNYPEAILTNVNFTNANLTNVNFHKAKFNNVIFKNADMTGAKLERKWYSYVKKQGVRNFDKIQWM